MAEVSDAIEVAVIGGGVVGAAVLQRLAERGLVGFMLERRARTGGETTERNSGVIHAGLYYPAASLKTRLSIVGNRALYRWAEAHGVPHARSGKLIVATDEGEEAELSRLLEHGRAAGVQALRLLSGREVKALEPALSCRAAILSGTTGVVDPIELTASLIAVARSAGAEVLVSAEVQAIEREQEGYRLETSRGPVHARRVVNAAGLYADEVARLAGVDRYRIYPCRGDYFAVRRKLPYRRLIYPVKKRGAPGLGVHLTTDLAGRARFGPDATYVESKADYGAPSRDKRAEFALAARKLFPEIRADDLEYDSCGLRPKLRAPSEPEEKDFVIAEDLPGFVNLVGIESPGLTAALAIAAEVERLLCG